MRLRAFKPRRSYYLLWFRPGSTPTYGACSIIMLSDRHAESGDHQGLQTSRGAWERNELANLLSRCSVSSIVSPCRQLLCPHVDLAQSGRARSVRQQKTSGSGVSHSARKTRPRTPQRIQPAGRPRRNASRRAQLVGRRIPESLKPFAVCNVFPEILGISEISDVQY